MDYDGLYKIPNVFPVRLVAVGNAHLIMVDFADDWRKYLLCIRLYPTIKIREC